MYNVSPYTYLIGGIVGQGIFSLLSQSFFIVLTGSVQLLGTRRFGALNPNCLQSSRQRVRLARSSWAHISPWLVAI